MAKPLCDPSQWIDAPLEVDLAGVQELIPQRFELGLLHGIHHHDVEGKLAIGFHQTSEDDFWVKGHIPGRPLMPGVVMVEAAAQVCAWLSASLMSQEEGQMFGFGGVDKVRFRGQVLPGQKLLLVSQVNRLRRSLARFSTQAFVDNEMVYEGEIIGLSF
ncbi:MAG: 3-hydroxyacyl-[acyl-carrier-protein] dehydratase [Pseudohongiellaceae bacterium]|jgi:3-hydroxyacyl-[acyl-carrier-protein] dehydratase